METVSQLKEVLEFSNRMLARVEGGNWQGLIEDEQQRQVMLQQCFEHPYPADQTGQIDELIKQILSVNNCISELCQKQYASLRCVMSDMQRGRNAVKAYCESQE